jgi:hypothetical protein
MKLHFTLLALFLALCNNPVFAQVNPVKLLTAKTALHFNEYQIVAGDSSTFQYNNDYQPNSTQIWYFDDGPNVWLLHTRFANYMYDSNGNVLAYVEMRNEGGNTWKDFQRYSFTYDAANRPLSFTLKSWLNNTWQLEYTTHWQYDAAGNVLSESIDKLNIRYLFSYNAQGLLDQKLELRNNNGTWKNIYLDQYAYLPNDSKVFSITNHFWEDSIWAEVNRSTYTYDNEGLLTTIVKEIWDGVVWNNAQRQVFGYDSNNNNNFKVDQGWSNEGWKDGSRESRTFDEDSDILSSRLEFEFMNTWNTHTTVQYYYTEFVSTQAPETLAFEVFPNPANTSVTLQGKDFHFAMLYDQQGRLVRAQSLQGEGPQAIQVQTLSPGNYVLKVLAKNGKWGTKTLQIRR